MSDQDLNAANTVEKILPLDMDDLPEFFQQKATREINYSPDIAENKLMTLKEHIEKTDTLKKLGIKDSDLLIFLTCRKFNIEETIEHLKGWLKFRKEYPECFKIPSLNQLSVFMTDELTTVLPWRCKDGCSVVYINFGNWNAKHHPVDAMKQFFTFVVLQCLRKPMTQVNGFKVIVNMDFSLDFMKICTPSNIYYFIHGNIVSSPARFKEIHLLNMFGLGKHLWQAAKIFLPAKLKDRVHIHKSCDPLKDFFSTEILPRNLGGDLRDYDMTWWLKKYLVPEQMTLWEN